MERPNAFKWTVAIYIDVLLGLAWDSSILYGFAIFSAVLAAVDYCRENSGRWVIDELTGRVGG